MVSNRECTRRLRLRTYRVGARGLWSTSLSCHDDLVDREDCSGSLGSELDGPGLGNEKIEDTLILGVQSAGLIIVLGL